LQVITDSTYNCNGYCHSAEMTSNKDNFHVIQKWYINKAYDIDGEKVHSVQEWKVCGNVLPNPIIFTKLPVTVKVEYTV